MDIQSVYRNKGMVSLVGAGPGDPGLITVRGLQCIINAHVIVYDALVNPALLEHARIGVPLLYAGKRSGRPSMNQDDINALLTSLAQQGKYVCRLKGGDPFVFGRGGEESLHLARVGIPFEVVPGVSAAVAVPAYAGIPVTHRGVSSAFHIVTGHESPDKKGSGVDWDVLAQSHDTLVIMMGLNRMREITRRLEEGARAGDTPAAVISDGTLPTQRTVVGTLHDIAERTARAGITSPAILVIGEVVTLRNTMAWFEKQLTLTTTIAAAYPHTWHMRVKPDTLAACTACEAAVPV